MEFYLLYSYWFFNITGEICYFFRMIVLPMLLMIEGVLCSSITGGMIHCIRYQRVYQMLYSFREYMFLIYNVTHIN